MLYVILLNLYTGYMFTPFTTTPQKTNMETKNGGLVQRIFFFKQVIFSWTMLVLKGVYRSFLGPSCVCVSSKIFVPSTDSAGK